LFFRARDFYRASGLRAGKLVSRLEYSTRAERVQQVVFEHGYADVVGSGDHVGGGADFVDLENCGFAAIAVGSLPGQSAQEIGVVEGGVVVAPVGDVFDGPGSGDGGFEARGLGDQPVVMYPP